MNKWGGETFMSKSSLEAAAEAAAKVNAMLIAKGKLKPSQLSQPQGQGKPSKNPGTGNSLMVAEVEINDVPIGCRNMLTRGSTQEDISKMSGAAVSTRGRYMTPEDRANKMGIMGDRALYLCVQGPTQESVDLAVHRVNEIIANGIKAPKGTRFSPAVRPPPPMPGNRPMWNQPPPLMSLNTQPTGHHGHGLAFVQDKLYIGLEHAPPNFDAKNKLLGPMGSYLQHVMTETGAKVTLRGKGSGFLEPTSGREAFEPMHIHIQHPTVMGLQQAKQLSENLIQTVQQEYALFQQALAALPPPITAGTAQFLAGLQQQANPGGNLIGQQPGITLATLTQQQMSALSNPGTFCGGYPNSLQPITSIPGMFSPQVTSVIVPASLASGLVSMAPNSFISAAPGTVLGAAEGMSNPATTQSFGMPTSMYTSLSPIPTQMITAISGPPPSTLTVDTAGGALLHPSSNIPPPMLHHSQGPPGSQIGPIMSTYTSEPQYIAGGTLTQGQPAQLLMGQGPGPIGQLVSQVTLPPPPVGPPQLGNPLPTASPPVGATITFQPGVQVVSQPGELPPNWVGPPLQNPPPGSTFIGQMPVSSGPPLSFPGSTVYVTSVPTSATYTVATSGYQYPPPPREEPRRRFNDEALVTTVPTSVTYTVASSGYQYPPPPREEPRRRFTEEKPEDKLPENLLGYEHGPPHLTNLVVSGPLPSSCPPVPVSILSQPSSSSPGLLATSVGTPITTHQGHMYNVANTPLPDERPAMLGVNGQQNNAGGMLPSPPPMHLPGTPDGENPDSDKKLMPPPPPGGLKRQSMGGGPPERKKPKGALGNVTAYGSDDEDEEIQSSMRQHQREAKKYSFNQYSNKPQMYGQGPLNEHFGPNEINPALGEQFQPQSQPGELYIQNQQNMQLTEQFGQEPPPNSQFVDKSGQTMIAHQVQQISQHQSLQQPLQQPPQSLSPSSQQQQLQQQIPQILQSQITLSNPPSSPTPFYPQYSQPTIQGHLQQRMEQPPPGYPNIPPPPLGQQQVLQQQQPQFGAGQGPQNFFGNQSPQPQFAGQNPQSFNPQLQFNGQQPMPLQPPPPLPGQVTFQGPPVGMPTWLAPT